MGRFGESAVNPTIGDPTSPEGISPFGAFFVRFSCQEENSLFFLYFSSTIEFRQDNT